MEKSKERIDFLDTTIYKSNDRLKSTLFTKPTDTHSYLHFNSHHPQRCKEGGPFGQLIRVRRNCTEDEDFFREASSILNHFKRRGYPSDLLSKAWDRAKTLTRSDTLKKQTKGDSQRIPLVLTYHEHLPPVVKLVHHFWPLLAHSETPQVFSEAPVTAFRRPPNLKDQIVRAKINYPPTDPATQGRVILNYYEDCTRPNCNICSFIRRRQHFTSTYTNLRYHKPKPASTATCETTNLVYLLTCQVCQKQYVGETKRSFRVRMKEHLADIAHERETPVARHFMTGSNCTSTPQMELIEVLKSDPNKDQSTRDRRHRELHWIQQLRTLAPLGLNMAGW